MKDSYWDSLEWIKKAVIILQKSPVPPDASECLLLKARLENAVHEIRGMVRAVRPYTTLWVGLVSDPLRGSAIPMLDYEELIVDEPNTLKDSLGTSS